MGVMNVGVMSVGVMSVGMMSVGVECVGVMICKYGCDECGMCRDKRDSIPEVCNTRRQHDY